MEARTVEGTDTASIADLILFHGQSDMTNDFGYFFSAILVPQYCGML